MAKEKTSWLGLRKGNRRRDCRTSATLPTHRPSVFSSSLNGGPSMSILPRQSEVPERKKETKTMVDRVIELSSHRQSIVTPSPECSIPSTKSARHASPLYCRRACAPSSLYYAVTRRSRTRLRPSLSWLMPRLSRRSSHRRSCHPVGAYRPSPHSYYTRRDKYLLPSTPLHFAATSNPSDNFDLLSSSLLFLHLPRQEHVDMCAPHLCCAFLLGFFPPALWCFLF